MSPSPPSPPSYDSISSSPSEPCSSSQAQLVHLSSRNPPPLKGDSPRGDLHPQREEVIHYYAQPGPAGRMISTTLGPETDEMKCLMQGHQAKARFGVVGIVAAVMFWPWGLALCAADRKVVCTRCKQVLDPGCF